MELEALIKPLGQLLEKGSCLAAFSGTGASNSEALSSCLTGLAHPCANGKNWVISQRLLSVRQQLSSNGELIAAILATSPSLHQAWCQLMAARCMEAGELSDPQVLAHLVSQLNGAAESVEASLAAAGNGSHDHPGLQPTAFVELERRLLGTTAEQSQCTPVLARVLAAAHRLRQWQQQPLVEIEAVDALGKRPDINWCSGRLIQQPGARASEFQYLLNGTASSTLPDNFPSLSHKAQTLAVMDWVFSHPWAYLLALIAYEQNVWLVEAAGALLLELPAGQSPQQPSEVQVLVANADGDELYCGSLGSLLSKILSSLNMAVFPAGCGHARLNADLVGVISELLSHKVWRYVEGLSGEQGYYQIHPDFSDACYGRRGQPGFSRFARHLRLAIRSQAVQWRSDRRSQGLHRDTPAIMAVMSQVPGVTRHRSGAA